MAVTVSIDIPAGRDRVWADVADLASHVEWMADAVAIEFPTARRSGAGAEAVVETRIGPFRTSDRMVFTSWEEPSRMAVEHQGLFTGWGEFTLEPVDGNTTRFTWSERIRFPWFLGGPIGAWLSQPVLRWVWRRNLSRLRRRFTAP